MKINKTGKELLEEMRSVARGERAAPPRPAAPVEPVLPVTPPLDSPQHRPSFPAPHLVRRLTSPFPERPVKRIRLIKPE